MSSLAHHPLYALGVLYIVVLVLRALLSWFPIEPGSRLASLNHWLYRLTEPVVAPVRKVVPPLGIFDISYIVVLLGAMLITEEVLYRIWTV